MIEIIEDKGGWDNFTNGFPKSDFYHTFDYHMIAKGEHRPVLLKYSHNEARIGLPLLIRQVPNTPFYDATSVYGYPGPIYNSISSGFDSKHYGKELLEYFKSNKIISVFSRLNPFLPLQHKVLEDIGNIEKKGVVVSIDLSKDIDTQRTEFRRRLKGQLNKSRKHCLVKKARDEKELKQFVKLYHDNMDRVNAKPMYYFDNNYFKVLAESNSFQTETLLAVHKDSGETIGASMFIYKNSVIHYHLAGTRNDSLPLMPSKLLIDEMRIKASQLGLSHFNLGGGLGGNNDKLLNFKSSFSKDFRDFYLWSLIVDHKVYRQLTAQFHDNEMKKFFPTYRLNES